MYDVLKGIRVVEVAEWTFVPVAGAVLADWGADVVKVENRNSGDPQRGLTSSIAAHGKINPMIEVPNRGKRSIGIDLATAGGRETLYKLVKGADVFITSLRSNARKKLGLEPKDIRAINPNIVYGRGSGYGFKGPDKEKGGYDWPSMWCRGGIAGRMTLADGEPPFMPGSIGDISGGTNLAGAIAAALVRRERTGKGAIVDHSLYSVGAWIMGQSIAGVHNGQTQPPFTTRANPLNPIVNTYPTKDGRWICLCLIQADAWWEDFCQHIGRDDLIDDPRFNSMEVRNENSEACVAEIEQTFLQRTFEEWRETLKTMKGVWDPVLGTEEMVDDPHALEAGIIVPVTLGNEDTFLASASPGQFDEEAIGKLTSCPEHAQHTEEILLEIGLEWEEIAKLKEAGAIS